MGKRKQRNEEVFEVEVTALGRKGIGIATAPDGDPIEIRGVPPDTVVEVRARRKRKGLWEAVPLRIIRYPASAETPRCAVFEMCGGCTLQGLQLHAQRAAKQRTAIDDIARAMNLSSEELAQQVTIHPTRGPEQAYAYRNKVELTFGAQRFLNKTDLDTGLPFDGRYLGFHAPGRFDKIVDAARCELISEPANQLLAIVRQQALTTESPPTWDPRSHTGFWRHLLLREGFASGEHLIGLYTAPAQTPEQEAAVSRLADALQHASLAFDHRLAGIVWFENDSVGDTAQGSIRQIWGRPWLHERLGSIGFQLSIQSFFQTSTLGAKLLYDTLGDAITSSHRRLYDLYCGIGSIGLYLHQRFDQIIGIEEIPQSIEDARQNAQRNGIHHTTYHAARVEEALDLLPTTQHDHTLIVDPPRGGLHLNVANALARAPGDELLYVACHPASLGRDALPLARGGWRLAHLWFVDLFPQTYHIEAIGRFERQP